MKVSLMERCLFSWERGMYQKSTLAGAVYISSIGF